ncbi:MAG: hypothetical protein NTV80_26845 [Verrucomicrobia bacterium]|nr:hypothetical protein [Verrucomicrobiota bacterium]
MNDFDQRWQTATQVARQVPAESADLPYGFTTRVLACFQESPAEAWSEVLGALGLRAMFATAFLFAISASFAAAHWYEVRIETPVLENPLSLNPLMEPFSSWL